MMLFRIIWLFFKKQPHKNIYFCATKNDMQTILGSGGIIGQEASFFLSEYTDKIRQVSRKPKKVNESDQVFPANLKIESEVRQAVKDSEVVYLTVGLPYNTKIWKEYWPKVMRNTINACKENNARLVFFDNVYMYGRVEEWMTETTPFNPCSKKGEVRAQIVEMLLEEMRQGNLQALIARSADFYGPKAANTYITPMIFDKLQKGKKAQLLISDQSKHSYTFTPDASRAMVLLGNTESAYGQTWHLPTDRNVLTGAEMVGEAARVFNSESKYSVLSPFMLNMASIFSPLINETKEMLYQNKYNYLFDSKKFEEKFFKPTTYKEGLEIIYQTQYKK
jgi:nucleoside-diphosphate-sugar epimerase